MQSTHDKVASIIHRLHARTHISRDLAALYASRVLTRIAFGSLGVFVPIFFYKEFSYDLEFVIALYLVMFGLFLLMVPLTVRLLRTLGTRRMLMLGLLAAGLSAVSLYYFPYDPLIATVSYAFFAALYRGLYWVPYHVDFAHSLDSKMRGRQLAFLRNIASAILIAVPMIGGFIITVAGFPVLFLFSIVLVVVSMIPLCFMQHTYERYSWGYAETFFHLFKRANRKLFLANAANGAQGVALTILWPIYVFVLLDERYTALGIIVSLTVVVVIILRALVGRLFDKWSQKKVLVVGVVLATTGWVSKLFVQTPFEIFTADSYHNFGQTVNKLSFDATTYEQSADNGRFIDEYTTLKEMALNIGRVLMLLGVAVLLTAYDLRIAFIVAAGVSLLMIFLNKSSRVQ